MFERGQADHHARVLRMTGSLEIPKNISKIQVAISRIYSPFRVPKEMGLQLLFWCVFV